MKRIRAGLVLLFAGCLTLAAGGKSRVFATETSEPSKQVIRVGYTQYGQMIQEDKNGITGYGVEYLQKLSAYTGWQYDYVLVTEKDRKQDLREGKIDLLCDISEEESKGENLVLSQENCSMFYGLLCAKADDNTIFYNDMDSINGKRIALNTSKDMEVMLREFAKDQKLSYTPVYCEDFESMEKALEEGRADLMLASNQRKLDAYKYVAKVGVQNQFFAVAEGHEEWMEQIDFADRQIKLQQPFMIALMYEKYYGRPVAVLNGQTREEYEFIQRHTPIRVACDANSYPIEYIDEKTGQYNGVYHDAMKLIERYTGLQFEFIPLTDYAKAWEMLSTGEVDMTAGMYINDALAEQYGIRYSNSYLNADYAMVCRDDRPLPEQAVIALPEQYIGVRAFVKEKHPEWKIVPGKSIQECFEMIEGGEADATLVNSIFLQTVYNLNRYKNLTIMPMHEMTLPIRCGVGGENAEILQQILNKAISHIPAENFERCVVENAINVAYEPSIRDIVQKFLPLFIGFCAIVIAVFLVSLKIRERHFRHLAMTDSITGLWNGTKFRREADDYLEHNRQKKYQMVSLDMERFKYVNNDYGEKVADGILQVIGTRIYQQFRDTALYARDMADMFLILTEWEEDIEERIQKLSEEIVFENNGREQKYKPVIKAGVCTILPDRQHAALSEYIDCAVMARKSIKGNAAKNVAYYNQEMAEEVSNERKIETKMEAALEHREFVVYYQPKFQLKSEAIIGAEALVRWQSPSEGLIPPNRFIPIFERNGFIIRLDFYVYEEVLKSMAKWRDEGRKPIVVSMFPGLTLIQRIFFQI